MTDLSDYSSTKAGDSELQDFLMVEKQKAQFHAQVCNFVKYYTIDLFAGQKYATHKTLALFCPQQSHCI